MRSLPVGRCWLGERGLREVADEWEERRLAMAGARKVMGFTISSRSEFLLNAV
jgi:hypothetical protein